MRTTLDLDRTLLSEAKEALGVDTYTQAIETALRDAVERARARRGWEALVGAEGSWASVEDLIAYRRRLGGRSV